MPLEPGSDADAWEHNRCYLLIPSWAATRTRLTLCKVKFRMVVRSCGYPRIFGFRSSLETASVHQTKKFARLQARRVVPFEHGGQC